MSLFTNKETKSVDELERIWPFNHYPDWLYAVICKDAQEDFEEAYSQNVKKVGFAKWFQGTPPTWLTAHSNWRKVYRERVVLSIFPAIVKEMNKPTWDVRWIEEYEDYNNGY